DGPRITQHQGIAGGAGAGDRVVVSQLDLGPVGGNLVEPGRLVGTSLGRVFHGHTPQAGPHCKPAQSGRARQTGPLASEEPGRGLPAGITITPGTPGDSKPGGYPNRLFIGTMLWDPPLAQQLRAQAAVAGNGHGPAL